MKNIAFLLLITLFLQNCSSDDDQGTSNIVNYNNNSYKLKSALAFNNNYYAPEGYTNYRFYFTDNRIDVENSQLYGSFFIYVELESLGEEKFNTGRFIFSESENQPQYKIKSAHVNIDGNGDGLLGGFDDERINANSVTVTVSGDNLNYTFLFDLNLENGTTVTGKYSGNFLYDSW